MKFVYGVISAVFVFMSVVPLPAAAEGQDVAELSKQVGAIRAYFERYIERRQEKVLDEAELTAGIQNGIEYLLTAQEDNGHFGYEYIPYEDKYRHDDNVVRQSGALFILSEVYKAETKKDAKLAKGIERSIEYFESITTTGEEGKKEFRCVGTSESNQICRLGTGALVLTGLVNYVEADPKQEKKYRDLITDYTNYILTTQKENGGFRDSYRPSKGFREDESPYSNGEAMLALARAYRHDPRADVKEAIDRAFIHLKDQEPDSALYLWIMAALKDMQAIADKPEYVTYANEFTAWRMSNATSRYMGKNSCAYAEGLSSAYSVLDGRVPEGTLVYLRRELDTLHRNHASLQLDVRDTYRIIGDGKGGFMFGELPDPARAKGGFLTSEQVVTERIDFTQHCVSSYLQTLKDIDNGAL